MSSHVLLIDNYDSFSYNLVQALSVLGARVTVRRNDEVTVQEAIAMAPSHLVVSPGPGRPEAAGVAVSMIEAMMTRIPILGVCLGHQAIGAALGGHVGPAAQFTHGKASAIYHDNRTLYQGLPNPFQGGRYHSLAVSEEDLPEERECDRLHIGGRDQWGSAIDRSPLRVCSFIRRAFSRRRATGYSGTSSISSPPRRGHDRYSLERLLDRRDLSEEEAADLMERLSDESVPSALSGALLAALRAKGENGRRIARADSRGRCAGSPGSPH